MGRFLKIIKTLLVAAAAIFCLVYLLIQAPFVQTYITEKLFSVLFEGKPVAVSVGKVHIKSLNKLMVRDLVVVDTEPHKVSGDSLNLIAIPYERIDTLAHVGYISARFSLTGLFRSDGVYLKKVLIKNTDFTIVAEPDYMSNIKRMFSSGEKTKKKGSIFEADKLTIEDLRFRLVSYRPKKKDYKAGVNWADARFLMKEFILEDLSLDGGIFAARIKSTVFSEKHGFHCNHLSADFAIRSGLVEINDFNFVDSYSDIHFPYFSMTFLNGKSFRKFASEVNLDIEFNNSYLHSGSLAGLLTDTDKLNAGVKANGHYSGPLKSFSVENLSFNSDNLSVYLDGYVKEILDLNKARLAMNRIEVHSTTSGADRVIHRLPSLKNVNLSSFLPETKLRIMASAEGTFENLNLKAQADAGMGVLSTSLKAEHLASGKNPVAVHGRVWSDDVNMGAIWESDKLGIMSFSSAVSANLSKQDGAVIQLDSLMINKLNFLGKDYSRIAAVGKLENNGFRGNIISQDPDCNFILQGIFSLSPRTKNKVYQFYANVGHADLHAMNIDKRPVSNISFVTNVNFTNTGFGDMLGDISLYNLLFENEEKKHDLGTITITSHSNEDIYRARFNSSFAEASFIGSASVGNFINDLSSVTLKKELPSLFKKPEYEWKNNSYNLTLKCINTAEIMSYIKPGLYLDNNTTLTANLNSTGEFSAKFKSRRFAMKGNYLKDINLNFDNRNDSLNVDFDCGEILVGSASLKNNSIKLVAENDNFGLDYSFDNMSELINSGKLSASGHISRESGKVFAGIHLDPSNVTLNSYRWDIDSTCFVISQDGFSVDSLHLNCLEQEVLLAGAYSRAERDTLSLGISRLDLVSINTFMEKNKDMDIEGVLTGKGHLYSENGTASFDASFLADSVSIAGTSLGRIKCIAGQNAENGTMDVDIHNILAGRESFRITGNYQPSEGSMDLTAGFDKLNVAILKPFVKSIFTDVSGKLSGTFYANGNARTPNLSSQNGRLENGELNVAFTGVPYSIEGPFHLDNAGIWFDNMALSDKNGNAGYLNGAIRHNHLKNMNFDANISYAALQLLNIPYDQGKGIYGNVSGTGAFKINGPLKNIVLTLDVNHTEGGRLHIPLGSGSKIEKADLLKFKEPKSDKVVDIYEEMMKKTAVNTSSNLLVRINAYAGQNVEALLEIDKSSGNVIAARGNGLLNLNIGKGLFDIKGDYVINSGSYRFVALGIASRDFSIQDGSTIKFNGNIMDSSLDIDAIWKTKTSVSTLIADTTSVNARNTVNCGINISDRLRNPNLKFSIDVPDLEPSVKSRVAGALNTDDKIQKQFLSLILSNSFIPDEQSGIFNNQSLLYSNMSEIMAGQLNNILQKLDIPVDLGLKYLPDQKGNGIFDVAVSTQLFNNRVVVNGNFGNRQYNSTSASDVVGDLDIEVKLDKRGAVRLTLFSHSADKYTNYLDNSQRNGIGVAYQRDFNSFKDLFKYIFSGKAAKESFRQMEYQEALGQGVKTIYIE